MHTQEQIDAVNCKTREHIQNVGKRIHLMVKLLLDRADQHDSSKLEEPELSYFVAATPKLASITYGSPEYRAAMDEIRPAIEHHTANNRHHPEHWKNGIDDMNLVDLLELLCDWSASSKRGKNGNILKSIEMNADRFDISPQLRRILENTAVLLEDVQ